MVDEALALDVQGNPARRATNAGMEQSPEGRGRAEECTQLKPEGWPRDRKGRKPRTCEKRR